MGQWEEGVENNIHANLIIISPAVIGLDSQSLASAGNVLLQRGAAGHPTSTSLLELWPSFWQPLAQVHLMELQDACGEIGKSKHDWLLSGVHEK